MEKNCIQTNRRIFKEGYNSNDIGKTFRIRGRNIIEKLIPQLFEVPSFSAARRLFLIEVLEDLIIEGLDQRSIADRLVDFRWSEIDNAIKYKRDILKKAQQVL